ncbi:hypothetical protein N9L68_00210 [bacterium]|nr:hypothetical protein [bacterium]
MDIDTTDNDHDLRMMMTMLQMSGPNHAFQNAYAAAMMMTMMIMKSR